MNTSIVSPRSFLPATILALAIAIPAIAHAGPEAPTVPQQISVLDGYKPFLVAHAVGVQIQECIQDAGGFRWRFVGPRADLYGDDGKLVATHFAGPSWQARDGSKVMATLDGNGSVKVDETAIPWLRLRVTSATAGADADRLVATKYIQRINTVGGLAPAAADCNAGTLGQLAEVPYTADYVFWKATGH